jgi:hypothetical protein
MKNSNSSHLLTLLLLIPILSCSPKKEPTPPKLAEACSNCIQENRLDSLLKKKDQDQAGPIKLKIQIDTIEFNSIVSNNSGQKDSVHFRKIVKPINKLVELTLDKESGLIVFGENFGIKLFHVEAMEYGHLQHMIRYDFFMKLDDCWRRKKTFSYYYDINSYLENPDFGFSHNDESSIDYVRFVAGITRIK